MIHIHILLFLTVLELAVVFAVLWVWWFIKARKQARQLVAMHTPAQPESAPDAQDYIVQELAVTHTQLGVQSEAAPELSTTPLTLRAAYLDLEREFAQGQERDAEFWESARERLVALLDEFMPAAEIPDAPAASADEAPAVPEDEEPAATDAAGEVETNESKNVKHLVDKQASTITELKDVLTALVGDQEGGAEVIEKVDKLGRASRELAMCVAILEDDNNLLRERLMKAGIIAD